MWLPLLVGIATRFAFAVPHCITDILKKPAERERLIFAEWSLPSDRLHYSSYGNPDAETIVMIHGLVSDSRTFESAAQSLSQYYRVVTIDLRGHGGTPAYGWNYSSKLLAEDLNSLLARLGIQRPVHLLGHSYGARVALTFAMNYPLRVRSLIFEDQGFQPQIAVRPLTSLTESYQLLKAKNDGIDDLLNNPSDPSFSLWSRIRDTEFVYPLIDSRLSLQSFASAVGKINVPTLFIYADRKNGIALPDTEIRGYRGLGKKFEFYEVPGSEHDIHNSQPHRFLQRVGEFVHKVVEKRF